MVWKQSTLGFTGSSSRQGLYFNLSFVKYFSVLSSPVSKIPSLFPVKTEAAKDNFCDQGSPIVAGFTNDISREAFR